MQRIIQRQFGGPEVLVLESGEDLTPAPGQVRIAVRASGVHLIDTTIRSGASFGPFPQPELPMTPGREVAGVVDEVGPGVDGTWLGRRVVAHLGMANGGYADQAVAAVESLHVIPDALSDDVAVAAIGTGRTAVGILDQVAITPYDVVLVPAAAGGLGVLLLQAARRAGAAAIGLAGGPAKLAVAADHGAELVVDYRRDDWVEQVRGFGRPPSLVFDGVGGSVGQAAFDLLAPGGHQVVFGWSAGETNDYDAADKKVLHVLGPALTARPGGLRSLEEEAIRRAADGSQVPLVGARFGLADAAEAHRALVERRTVGKVVLTPREAA
ncbi:zinc-binding dehydrogenase [Nocardioides sp.]|uniref:zinc-binding dehydrogenase n=1 Tax=Nocardioides sp. TaxID=35761 RepID=UPI002734B77D|nr:zinc-binding dehydrogenase [Nocardioides sp.]MDP3891163.1 zinc-binding dehydrogenase [Nocardioides sp.]